MKLKKYITLLLSALMLVCALTACGPSVEHRFDTEEYSARAEATMRSIAQQLAAGAGGEFGEWAQRRAVRRLCGV